MKVSICCITYNQEKFIANAIEGILMQQTNCPVEIIIGDDCSNDGTGAICAEYAKNNSGTIKLLTSEKNIGMMANFVRTLKACSGKYIALCEGDDYWCDKHKLQKQVDFLEANSNYALCFHRTYELRNDILVLPYQQKAEEEHTFTIENLATANFIVTPSVVFRNNLFTSFPSWIYNAPAGDYVLHMLNARHGLIKYFPEPMAVYRIHDGGIWSSTEGLKRLEKMVLLLSYLLQEDFSSDVKQILQKQLNKNQENHLKALMKNDDWTEFLKVLADYSGKNKYIAQKWLLEYYPKQIRAIKSSRAYRIAAFLKRLKHSFRKES
ncbi:MAG TPA: glycosyltransferase [Chitinophagaceae bacterium]|nr:glycosyltransferase [Chitinophagaceae bacterium]